MSAEKNLFEHIAHRLPPAERNMRLWLRLLGCFTSIERSIRRRLMQRCHATLPRYDALNALATFPDGLTMGELANLLMVSNGNVTGVIRRLRESGLVKQATPANDRRSQVVTLTSKGREDWQDMQEQYAAVIDEFFAHLPPPDIDALVDKLGKLQEQVDDVATR